MSKQTRRSFLAMTTASAACLPMMKLKLKMKAFSAAALAPAAEQTPSGTVSVHVTAGDQRYSPSGSLTWQSAGRVPSEDTIILRGVGSKQPILGFGAAFTDAACFVLNQLPEAERERLLLDLFDPGQLGLSACRLCIGSSDYA